MSNRPSRSFSDADIVDNPVPVRVVLISTIAASLAVVIAVVAVVVAEVAAF
jgi:hypothetical protein